MLNTIQNNDSNRYQQKADKSLKMRKELVQFYYSCLMHKEISTQLYDYYMDFSPKTIRKAFTCLFQLNKFFQLLLIHFMFYHSIWWSPNSVSNNLAINYSLIDLKLFSILVYLNFYELIINQLIFNLIVINVLRHLQVPNAGHIRQCLTYVELAVYFVFDFVIFGYLKFKLNFPNETIALFLVPHVLFFLNNHFDLNFTILNRCLFSNLSFTNQASQHRNASNNQNTYSQSSVSSSETYSDLLFQMEASTNSNNKSRY
jgi:hypothetical protein